ncbi:MAG: hypothetical protein NTW86_06165 [Candidatus Sumerlaeota bacterium]|nr:hypothetical protein [Candidatus Sumerlaeota bacterium]
MTHCKTVILNAFSLKALNVSSQKWYKKQAELDSNLSWVKDQLKAHHPVLCGVKLYPDEHPS